MQEDSPCTFPLYADVKKIRTVPKQSPTTEDFQQMDLSIEVYGI